MFPQMKPQKVRNREVNEAVTGRKKDEVGETGSMRQNIPTCLVLECYDDLDVRCPPQAPMFDHLVCSWWYCYGRF